MSEVTKEAVVKNRLTLSALKETVENRWGAFEFEVEPGKVYRVENTLRLSKEQRKIVASTFDGVEAAEGAEGAEGVEDVDLYDRIMSTFKAVTSTPRLHGALDRALGGDVAMAIVLFEEYLGVTEAGEASPSVD